jgi:hypothetical protein
MFSNSDVVGIGFDNRKGRRSMSQWSDIQKHVRGAYRLQDDQPEMMAMVWAYDDGRHQKVVMRRFASAGRDHIEFKSPFAKRGQVDCAELLEANAKLPLGAVALSGDVFLVMHNALATTLTTEDVDFLLQRIADIADSLEAKYVRTDEF